MPAYDYRCPECATEFEVIERMADEPGGRCPACGARGSRLFRPAGIVFKGSGFYKTDSRGANGGPASDSRTDRPDKPVEAAPATSPDGPAKEGAKATTGGPSPPARPAPATASAPDRQPAPRQGSER